MSVGKRIAEVRNSKRLTQEYLASRLGKTPQWLSNIERGTRPIAADELAKIAVILDVEPSVFFDHKLNKTLNRKSKLPQTGTD